MLGLLLCYIGGLGFFPLMDGCPPLMSYELLALAARLDEKGAGGWKRNEWVAVVDAFSLYRPICIMR